MSEFYVRTESGYTIGPYDSYAFAWYAALENFGLEGWVITEIKGDREE